VLSLVRQKKNYRLAGQDKLRIELKLPDLQSRVAAIRQAFGELAACRN
jgi:transcription-repair coupling factor (superfamily II helicase)